MGNDLKSAQFRRLAHRAEEIVNQNRGCLSSKIRLPHDLAIVMGGWKNTGKTSLLYYLRKGKFYTGGPTTGPEQFEIETFGRSARLLFAKKRAKVLDRPGEMEQLFEKMLSKVQPHGVVFMVDHENLTDHQLAWERFVNFIDTPQRIFSGWRNSRARHRLSTILVLVNKMDAWRHPAFGTSTSPHIEIQQIFQHGVKRLAKHKIKVHFEACSLKTGDNVDGAFTKFLILIIRAK